MKKHYFLPAGIYLIPLTALFLSSCFTLGTYVETPYIIAESRQKENFYYVPSSPNTSLLTEKNDFDFSVTRSSGSQSASAEIQAAYMPWKHVGINASYSGGRNEGNMHYDRIAIGSGYVTKFTGGWHFETYAGLGNTIISNSHFTGSSRINLNNFFLQPAMTISSKKQTVQLGLISKFEGVHFTVTDTSFRNAREPFSATQLKSLYDQPFHVMWQPGFVFRFGWKKILFHTGYSLTTDLTNPNVHKTKDNMSFGLSLRLNTSEKKTVTR